MTTLNPLQVPSNTLGLKVANVLAAPSLLPLPFFHVLIFEYMRQEEKFHWFIQMAPTTQNRPGYSQEPGFPPESPP